jgi:hypothetical protein
MNRRLVSWTSSASFGALGASFCVASACSQAAPPGFSNNSGNNGGSDNSSSSTSGNNGGGTSSSSSSGGTVYTNNGGGSGNNGNGNSSSGNSSSGNSGNGNSGSTSTGTGTTNTGSSSSTGAASTGTGTGTGTGATGAATGCGTLMTPPTCSAPVATGAFQLSSSCYQSTLGSGGYVSPAEDTGGSTGCVDSTYLCGSGTLVAPGATYANWGAAIGFNVGQASGAKASTAVAVKGTGLTWSLAGTSVLPNGLQISLIGADGVTQYCYRPAAAVTSATTAWGTFAEDCYNATPGTAFTTATTITQIQFSAITGTNTGAWNFCVGSNLAY